MYGIDPRTASPDRWSLAPEDTLGLVFWTRNPASLIQDKGLLEPYQKVIHFTLTGWEEVEHRAPTLEEGLELMARTAEAFGPEKIVWRFSPIPDVPDVLERFCRISQRVAELGITQCYLAYLQPNDLMQEARSKEIRRQNLVSMAVLKAPPLEARLCNEDDTFREGDLDLSIFMPYGVCEDGSRFASAVVTEGCGCALMVDPFTVNESCIYGCKFCYAADKSLSPKKRSTTTSVFRLPLSP